MPCQLATFGNEGQGGQCMAATVLAGSLQHLAAVLGSPAKHATCRHAGFHHDGGMCARATSNWVQMM